MRSLRWQTTVEAALLLFAIAVLAVVLEGCSSPAVKAKEAEAGYLAQQLDCVGKYQTRAEIDACRLRVSREWAADGGAE